MIDGKATTKNHFLATAKKSLYILPDCITTVSDNNYSTKLAAYILKYPADPADGLPIICQEPEARPAGLAGLPRGGLPAIPSILLYYSCHPLPCHAADLIMLMKSNEEQ